MRLVVIQDCAVPYELSELVETLKRDVPRAVLQSAYRGDDAKALLHAHGKHTQRELYNAYNFVKPRPSWAQNPANPPDRGSHLLIGDGTVGKLFSRLEIRQCGLDWNDGEIPELIAAAKRRGWTLYQPYRSGSEYHHLCARDWPALGAVLGLKLGDRRTSVGDLTRRLHYVGRLTSKHVHTVFDGDVQTGVKSYQKHAGLKADGVVGPATWSALDRSVRRKKARAK